MIAIVYPQFYGVGGIARYLDCFLANLPDEHPKIYLLTSDKNRRLSRYRGVEIVNIPATSDRLKLLVWTFKVRKVLKQLYKQKKIQCINLHTPPLIHGMFLPRNIPMCLTLHTTYLAMSGEMIDNVYFESQWRWLAVRLKYMMERYIFTQADKVIALTENGKQEALAYGYKKPVDVIPNGVDLVKFKPNAELKKDIDVLFCGRIELRKGSRSMVALCKSLIKSKPNIKIYIVGHGEDEHWVRAQLRNHGSNVTFAGTVSLIEVTTYYQRSHIYASTSYYEGFPRPSIEAMATELPCVVWDLPFYHDLIDSNTGLLVSVGELKAMSELIIALLKSAEQRKIIGSHARQHVEANYNWQSLSKDIINKLV